MLLACICFKGNGVIRAEPRKALAAVDLGAFKNYMLLVEVTPCL
jgi:hypothetical protein